LPRDATLKVRLTPSELANIRRAAETEATTLSALVRAGLAAVIDRKPLLTPEEGELLRELREQVRRAGINLNALLKTVHLVENGVTKAGPNFEDYRALYVELRAALDRLTEATRATPL
jgi:hypothetical protein